MLSQSWSEDYDGVEPDGVAEVEAPFSVEIKFYNTFDLWQEVESLEEVEYEVKLLKDRGFEYQVMDRNGVKVRV